MKHASNTPVRGRRWTASVVAVAALACMSTLVAVTGQAQAAIGDPAGWQLTWSDEFTTAAGATPSAAKWGYDLGGGGFGNAEKQLYTSRPENVSTDGAGNLAITARKESLAGSSCWYGTCQYTSGRILTKLKFTQKYGRFETRMKLPAGQGMWPAFWMQGDDTGSGGTAWPGRGELDVMELIGKEPSTVHGSIHGPGYSGGAAVTKAYTLPGGAKFADAFHTFTVDWSPNSVTWYVDGVAYESRTPADLPAGAPWVFDHPFYLLLNLAVGGQWPGDPDATTTFPQTMLVDYVRVYSPAATPAVTPTPTPTPTPTATPSPTTSTRDAFARIEAESFAAQSGVLTESTTDIGGGTNVGHIANGDSVTYRGVNFGNGASQLSMRVASGAAASATGTAEIHLDSATGPIGGSVVLSPTGGWQSWVTRTAAVTGVSGVHDLVVVFRSAQAGEFANVNWLTFTPAVTRDATARIEAESFDAQSGVLTETTTDTGGGLNIGHIANGDTATYRAVNFGSGANQVSMRVASGAAVTATGTAEVHLDSATGPIVGTVALGSTGGWQSWVTRTASVTGVSGIHDLVVVFRSAQAAEFANVNWLSFVGTGVTPAPTSTPTTAPTPTSTPTTAPTPTSTTTAAPGTTPISFVNNTGGRWATSQIFVTALGQTSPGQWSYLRADGSTRPINHLDTLAVDHLTKNGQAYPNMSIRLDQAQGLALPAKFEGARMYISLGSPLYIPVSADDRGWGGPNVNNPSDPNADVYFDWYEFTSNSGVYNYGGNTTQVDQFGFPFTVRLQQDASGYDRTDGITATRAQVYAQYAAAVGPAFASLATPYRIVAPRTAPTFSPGGAQAGYLAAVIDQTWAYYTTHPFSLTRLGQTFIGKVVGSQLQFAKGSVGGYVLNKPTTTDALQCSGALASGGMKTVELELGAEFCAALNRGVSLNTADWYRPAAYYPTSAAKNDYSSFFHAISMNGRAYGFAYDDINDQSTVQILPNRTAPTRVTITIGW